jgi:hypothetical protein
MVETVSDAVQKLKPETEHVYKDLQRQREVLSEWSGDHTKELSELADNKDLLIAEISFLVLKIDCMGLLRMSSKDMTTCSRQALITL